MLDMTLWADKPTTIPLTPPTVSRGWMLIPRTWRVARHPPKISSQEARPENGRTTRSIVLSCKHRQQISGQPVADRGRTGDAQKAARAGM